LPVAERSAATDDNDLEAEPAMRRLIDIYYRLLNLLLVVTVAILVIPVTIQILSRHTELIPSWIWTEEMARFFFIWMIMIGSMVGIRDGAHFDVDLWPELKPRANALLRVVADVFVLVMALVFVWYGIRFVEFGWNQTSELAELPMGWIFAAWPLAGFTWLVFLGERFVANLRIVAGGAAEVRT
jgi:TRAP-type transport system small permease protein